MSIEECVPVSLQRVSENQYFGCPVCDEPAIHIRPNKSGGYRAWGQCADGGPIRNRWTRNAKIQRDQEPVSSPFGFAGKLFAKNFERLSYLADNSDGLERGLA